MGQSMSHPLDGNYGRLIKRLDDSYPHESYSNNYRIYLKEKRMIPQYDLNTNFSNLFHVSWFSM